MIRISSLPVAERCGGSLTLGSVDSSRSKRGTVFHEYCATGKWPQAFAALSKQDQTELKGWHKPADLVPWLKAPPLQYADARKEFRVSLGKDLEYYHVPDGATQEQVEADKNILISGTIDMAWEFLVPDGSKELGVVVGDIKSSIHAVSDGPASLQLLAYGLALCKRFKATTFIPAIWDATDGRWFVGDRYEKGLQFLEIESRILQALEQPKTFSTGTHCRGCWRRFSCPAHLIDTSASDAVKKVLGGSANADDVRSAMVDAKRLRDLSDKVTDACKDWVSLNGRLLSEDGSKYWAPHTQTGRKHLDVEALLSASGLEREKYERISAPIERWDWRRV